MNSKWLAFFAFFKWIFSKHSFIWYYDKIIGCWHDWTKWEKAHVENYQTRKCKKCGRLQVDKIDEGV